GWGRSSPRRRSQARGNSPNDLGAKIEERFPFRLRDAEGSVSVSFHANDDPERWGYGVLGLPWPSALAEGLPVFTARPECSLDGCAAVMGWVQFVRIDVPESSQGLVDAIDKGPA